MAAILDGIRVLEFSTAIQGPAAGQYLADLGAEVVKVEPPIGDSARHVGRLDALGPEAGSQFVAVNRGKRSVSLDAHSELGRAVLHRLAARSDVFLSNYRAPALARMQLDAGTLQALNPRLIYAAVSGFGPLGDDAHKAMVDSAALARGGLLYMTGPPEGRPMMPGATIADTAGAMSLALGVMTALFARERTGEAHRVDTSALSAQLWLQMWELQHAAVAGSTPLRAGSHHQMLNGPVGTYTSSDGVHYQFALMLDVTAWQAFWAFAGEPATALDPRWDIPGKQFSVGAGPDDVAAVRACMLRAFAARTSAEWDAFLAAQPELICERVRDYAGVLADPQNIANGTVARMRMPSGEEVPAIGTPVVFDLQPRTHFAGPPARGEGTREIMESLGFEAAEIAALEAHTDAVRRRLLGL